MKHRRRFDGVGVLIALTFGLAILNCDTKSQGQTDNNPAKAGRIRPEDLAYQGAFRLPDGPAGAVGAEREVSESCVPAAGGIGGPAPQDQDGV